MRLHQIFCIFKKKKEYIELLSKIKKYLLEINCDDLINIHYQNNEGSDDKNSLNILRTEILYAKKHYKKLSSKFANEITLPSQIDSINFKKLNKKKEEEFLKLKENYISIFNNLEKERKKLKNALKKNELISELELYYITQNKEGIFEKLEIWLKKDGYYHINDIIKVNNFYYNLIADMQNINSYKENIYETEYSLLENYQFIVNNYLNSYYQIKNFILSNIIDKEDNEKLKFKKTSKETHEKILIYKEQLEALKASYIENIIYHEENHKLLEHIIYYLITNKIYKNQTYIIKKYLEQIITLKTKEKKIINHKNLINSKTKFIKIFIKKADKHKQQIFDICKDILSNKESFLEKLEIIYKYDNDFKILENEMFQKLFSIFILKYKSFDFKTNEEIFIPFIIKFYRIFIYKNEKFSLYNKLLIFFYDITLYQSDMMCFNKFSNYGVSNNEYDEIIKYTNFHNLSIIFSLDTIDHILLSSCKKEILAHFVQSPDKAIEVIFDLIINHAKNSSILINRLNYINKFILPDNKYEKKILEKVILYLYIESLGEDDHLDYSKKTIKIYESLVFRYAKTIQENEIDKYFNNINEIDKINNELFFITRVLLFLPNIYKKGIKKLIRYFNESINESNKTTILQGFLDQIENTNKRKEYKESITIKEGFDVLKYLEYLVHPLCRYGNFHLIDSLLSSFDLEEEIVNNFCKYYINNDFRISSYEHLFKKYMKINDIKQFSNLELIKMIARVYNINNQDCSFIRHDLFIKYLILKINNKITLPQEDILKTDKKSIIKLFIEMESQLEKKLLLDNMNKTNRHLYINENQEQHNILEIIDEIDDFGLINNEATRILYNFIDEII